MGGGAEFEFAAFLLSHEIHSRLRPVSCFRVLICNLQAVSTCRTRRWYLQMMLGMSVMLVMVVLVLGVASIGIDSNTPSPPRLSRLPLHFGWRCVQTYIPVDRLVGIVMDLRQPFGRLRQINSFAPRRLKPQLHMSATKRMSPTNNPTGGFREYPKPVHSLPTEHRQDGEDGNRGGLLRPP